jgi:hypothetical protein
MQKQHSNIGLFVQKDFLHKWHWWSTLVLKRVFCTLTWAFARKYFHKNDIDDWPWCYKNLSTLWHRHLHENNFAQIMSMIDLGVWRIFLHLDMGICMKKIAQISTFNFQILLQFIILLPIIKNLLSIWKFYFKIKNAHEICWKHWNHFIYFPFFLNFITHCLSFVYLKTQTK